MESNRNIIENTNAKMSGGYLTLYMQYSKNPKHVYKFLGVKYHNEKKWYERNIFKTYKAVGVFGSGTASCTFSMATFADRTSIASPITLLRTHHFCY